MKFRDFLFEQKEKHAVMAFGRMNPITVGHEKLVNKVQEIAKKVGGSAHIVVSHSQDPKKNPLTSAQKLKHAKRAFPGVNVSASDASAPNFLAQASKLHKQGVTHFHMVGGSDRADEYKTLLNKYNNVKGPHGHFNFKHIEVHSAGDRDPDAEGVEGMSASKMREHASNGNFKEFRKGVPSKMTDAHAKEMFNHVRQGMGVNENVDEDFETLLVEGVHDKSIFKAVFLAGGPGSGKDYVLDNTLSGHGLTEINSDKALEFLMDKEGLDKTMPASEQEKRDLVRGRAKSMTELRQRLALLGRNGLIINGTGDDAEKIGRIKERLEEIGYDTSMVMVNTDDEVSKQRNIERGQRGGRTVPEEIRKQKWDAVQASRPEFAKMFGDRYMEFDNSEDLRQAPPEVVKAKKDEMLQLFKNIQQFVSEPPSSEAASLWVAHEMDVNDKLPIPKDGAEMTPHADSNAAQEARKMGLQYYGFGRYGKNGKVTHRSIHDKLVEVQKDEPEQPNIPVPGTSMKNIEGRTAHQIGDETIHVKRNKKKIDEEFEQLFEAIGQGGRDYEDVINTRLKKYGKARPDATTAGSSADAPDASFLHRNKEHNLEIKADKGAMFGQMELHHNGKEWDASEKSKKKYPETYNAVKKSGFFKTLNSQWKKPSGNYEKDLKMGNVYHEHPNADPIKAHYGKDRKTNYIQIGGGHGFYHTGNDVAKLGSPELHGKTQIRARMKPRGYDAQGNRTYGALAVMSLKGDVQKSHHDLDKNPVNEDLRRWFSKTDPEGGWKRINSKGEAIGPCAREPGEPKPKCMSNEKRRMLSKKERAAAVAAKRRHDPNPERKGEPINVSNFGKGKLSESYALSDSSAMNLLLLGTSVDEVNLYFNGENNTYDFAEEKKETKLLRDKSGKVRTFMLRRAAAKEAHTMNGTVMPYKNGYVIKLNEENENVSSTNQPIQEQKDRGISVASFRRVNQSGSRESGQLLSEGVTELTTGSEYAKGGIEITPTTTQETGSSSQSNKITLAKIRAKQKEIRKESIDKGIEPGLSMATSGENATRQAPKNKMVKKPLEEMQGDETTASIGDKKEDELKKVGINLQSFKSKRPI